MLINYKYLFFLLVGSLVLASCKKDWLDVKASKSLIVPTKIEDYQSLLDNSAILNGGQFRLHEFAGLGADEYYLEQTSWLALGADYSRTVYTFSSDIWEGKTDVRQWNAPYQRVFYANVVLDGLAKYTVENGAEQFAYNNVKGNALFYRAHSFYWLAQIYAKQYDQNSAKTDLGVPIRLNSDLNEKTVRASVFDTYKQIIADLKAAAELLPNQGVNKERASKTAAFALLARTYLTIKDYENALIYADAALQLSNTLMDFSKINASPTFPVAKYNVEVIFSDVSPSSVFQLYARVDPLLYASYQANDLRKTVYFKITPNYKTFNGGYNNNANVFGGLAVDEMYLTRAECYARKGDISAALNDLNILRVNRYQPGSTAFTANTADEALFKVVEERKKELCFRGLRWIDLRRLNDDANFRTTVTHPLDGNSYKLLPNDIKYVYPIPDDIIRLTGIQQNQR